MLGTAYIIKYAIEVGFVIKTVLHSFVNNYLVDNYRFIVRIESPYGANIYPSWLDIDYNHKLKIPTLSLYKKADSNIYYRLLFICLIRISFLSKKYLLYLLISIIQPNIMIV